MRSNLFLFMKALQHQGAYPTPDGTQIVPLFHPTGELAGFDTVAGAQNQGVTPGTVLASRAVVVDANKDIASFRHLTIGGNLRKSIASVAATGTNQATAAAITADLNFVTLADGTVGVILPSAVLGDAIEITNTVLTAAGILKVYPATGATIGTLSANSALSMLPGETIIFKATSTTSWLTNANLRVASGLLTTASAADTVVTGLRAVRACFASYGTDPADANTFVSATIGDQAGTPAAGSIIVKTWKSADGADVTPAAASTFSKLVNWCAIGN